MPINLYQRIDDDYILYPNATHYTVSEHGGDVIRIYDAHGKDDLTPVFKISKETFVEVLDYHMGDNLDWAMVTIPDANYPDRQDVYYLKVYDILPIKNSAGTINFKIPETTTLFPIVDNNYSIGKWYKKDERNPFYNRKTQEYMITIESNLESIPKDQAEIDEIGEKGLRGLLKYYAKEDSEQEIQRLLQYRNFIKIKKFHVPPRPSQKTKCLVSIHAKYFNALAQKGQDLEQLSQNLVGETSDGETFRTVLLNTSKFANQIKYIARKFDLYHDKVKSFKGNVKGVNFKREKKHLNNMFLSIKKLISDNGLRYDDTQEYTIELGVDNCDLFIYALYAQPFSTELSIGFDNFKNKKSSKRSNTTNVLISIYDVISDLKSNIDWFNFASKYFVKTPTILPTKRLSSSSKSKDMSRNPLDVFFQRARFYNNNPYFDINMLHEINSYISDTNVTKGVLRENRKSREFVGDTLYNDLPSLIPNLGTIEDIYTEIMFKIGLKDIIGKVLACVSKELKIQDSKEVLVRGFLQSVSYERLKRIIFSSDECVPEAIKFKVFVDLFINASLGIEQFMQLLDLIGVDPYHLFSFQATLQTDQNGVEFYSMGGVFGVLTDLPDTSYLQDNFGVQITTDPLENCKIKITDFLSSRTIVLALSKMIVSGVPTLIRYDFDNPDMPITLQGLSAIEVRERILENIHKVIRKSKIVDSMHGSISQIVGTKLTEIDILNNAGPYSPILAATENSAVLAASINNFANMNFMDIVIQCLGLEDEISAFFGFVKTVQTKYANIKGNFEIPDIVLGKSKFDFSFNNVFGNPTFDMRAFNLDFLDDIMADVFKFIMTAIKEAVKNAILSVIQSMVNILDECINGTPDSINDALYGQECLKELYEASGGTIKWEDFMDEIFEEALERSSTGICKECPDVIPRSEQYAFMDEVCETLTPNELIGVIRSSTRGGISDGIYELLVKISENYPNIHCILTDDIAEDLFGKIGDMIDDDLVSTLEKLYDLNPGVPIASCLNTSYGEETIQNPAAALEASCDTPQNPNNCISIPKRFRSVREMLACRGLSDGEINSQINDIVKDKKDELVNMIVSANKNSADMLPFDSACGFLPKPSQIPAMKFAADLFFESTLKTIKTSYISDVLTYPDIMIHPDPDANDATSYYVPLKIEEGEVYAHTFPEEPTSPADTYTLVPVEAETTMVNPNFISEYVSGEDIYNFETDFFGHVTRTKITDNTVTGGNMYKQIRNTIDHRHGAGSSNADQRPFDESLGGDKISEDLDIHIKKEREIKRVAPMMKNNLSGLVNKINSSWRYEPPELDDKQIPINSNIDHYTYAVSIGNPYLAITELGKTEDALYLPNDITSGRPDCQEFDKLATPSFCNVDEQTSSGASSVNSILDNLSLDNRYDQNLYSFVQENIRQKLLFDSNTINLTIIDNLAFIGLYGNNSALNNETNYSFSDTESHKNINKSVENETLGVHGINHFHNMIRSVIDLFAEAIENSPLFDPKLMQTFKIEPRAANINRSGVDKTVKSLLDFDGALKRAIEYYDSTCTFKSIKPGDKTELQLAALYACIILTIRIYVIDLLMRGVFLLTTVLKEEISDGFFAIIFQNFQKDIRDFSPEYYDALMVTMKEIYIQRKNTDSTLPDINDEVQVLKYFMTEEVKLMNISMQEIFKNSFANVKRATLESMNVYRYQDFLSIVTFNNNDPNASTTFQNLNYKTIQSTREGIMNLMELLSPATNQSPADLSIVKPTFYMKKYIRRNAANIKDIWNETNWANNQYTHPDTGLEYVTVGIDLCFLDKDINQVGERWVSAAIAATTVPDDVVPEDYSGTFVASNGGAGVKVLHQLHPGRDNNLHFTLIGTDDIESFLPSKYDILKMAFESLQDKSTANPLELPYIINGGFVENYASNMIIPTRLIGDMVHEDGTMSSFEYELPPLDVVTGEPIDTFLGLTMDEYISYILNDSVELRNEYNRLEAQIIEQNYDSVGFSTDTDGNKLQIDTINDYVIGNFISIPVCNIEVSVPAKATFSSFEKRFELGHLPAIKEILMSGINSSDPDHQESAKTFNAFFDSCIPVENLYDAFFAYTVAMSSMHIPNIEGVFSATKQKLKATFNTLNKRFDDFKYRDGDIKEKGGTSGLYQRDTTFTSTTPDASAIAAKFAAMTPFMIIKGLAEQFDPNIKIAKFVRSGALAAGIDLPIQLASAAVAIPPPIATGIIPGPFGLIYLGTEFLEPKERERVSEIKEGVNSATGPTSTTGYTVQEGLTTVNPDLDLSQTGPGNPFGQTSDSQQEMTENYSITTLYNIMDAIWEELMSEYESSLVEDMTNAPNEWGLSTSRLAMMAGPDVQYSLFHFLKDTSGMTSTGWNAKNSRFQKRIITGYKVWLIYLTMWNYYWIRVFLKPSGYLQGSHWTGEEWPWLTTDNFGMPISIRNIKYQIEEPNLYIFRDDIALKDFDSIVGSYTIPADSNGLVVQGHAIAEARMNAIKFIQAYNAEYDTMQGSSKYEYAYYEQIGDSVADVHYNAFARLSGDSVNVVDQNGNLILLDAADKSPEIPYFTFRDIFRTSG
tara:strand:+ start:32335 stop:40008 length:7674 start_codon:yes stop_codon:yes gene_type:complete